MSESFTPRKQHAEERRGQILDAALHVFSQKGFDGASIREIAKQAGVTEGLIYHYFESKEHLQEATWKERTWRARLETILANAEGKSLRSVLEELIGDFMGDIYENREMTRMCSSEMQRNPQIAREFTAMIEDDEKVLIDFVAERRSRGEIRADSDVRSAAKMLMGWAFSTFLLYNRLESPEWYRLQAESVPASVDIVMRGVE